MATVVPGTLLLAFISFGGCMIPPGQANSGGSYPPNGGGGGNSSAPASGEPAAPMPSSSTTSTPVGAQVVSVTLHNDCSNTVKLFLGQKPKFGSGTNTSLGSNTTTSYQMKPGDTIWITDESENGISSTSIGNSSSQSVRIKPSCTDFGS